MKQKNLILMVVAVGCGLVAAFLTSQMNAKPQVETVDVVVAATDIPVGVGIGKEDLQKYFKTKKVSKDAVPTDIIESPEEAVERRLSRPIRAEETISRKDLMKGGIRLPPGKQLLTLQLDTARAAAGLAQPGAKVDVLAFVSLNNKLTAMPILTNMLILAVNGQTTIDPNTQATAVNTVSFAADRKQGLVLELAKGRGCQMSLLLRNPDEVTDNDKSFNIDEVITLLQDDKNPAGVALAGEGGRKTDAVSLTKPETPAPTPAPEVAPTPTPKPETVRVPYALVDIKGGTELTADLIADETVFGTRELPKDVAGDAVTDLSTVAGKTLRSGLGKGQWVTPGLVGDPLPKLDPPPPPVTKAPEPVRPTRDVTVHTGTGSKTFRYEEWAPGRWRLVGEVRGQATAESAAPAPDAAPAPKPTPTPVPEQRVD
ncbi:Flp pilus assembly protein CpaB [Urbifossiella limnaea]|uniref:SAF domain protein n=1 Tax=Urbifossiella limnaea TaxID=2528023 RepID=A0A517XM37_9BACT|nr:Flp pilus assembly protein CpaB [Urbifossiella limnaea]QDU18571.1 SAF domain protein [Urbifossiella limnaea]